MKVIEQCLVLDTFNAALVSELMCTGHNRLYKDICVICGSSSDKGVAAYTSAGSIEAW